MFGSARHGVSSVHRIGKADQDDRCARAIVGDGGKRRREAEHGFRIPLVLAVLSMESESSIEMDFFSLS